MKKVVVGMENQVHGFVDFIREQGVVGLAIGFILGGAVSSVVKSFVDDIIEPILGIFIGSSEGLQKLAIGPVTYGNFLIALVDFLIISAVVYFGFRKLGVAKLDKDKNNG